MSFDDIPLDNMRYNMYYRSVVVRKPQPETSARRKGTVPEQEAFLAVMRTADALMGDLAELLKPHGISPTQYNALRILRGAGAGCCDGGHADPSAKGIAVREIGDRMITRDPDMTRLLDRLEARGLIARARDSTDRRVVTSRITEQGLALLAGLDEPVLDLHRRQLGHLGPRKLGELSDLLCHVRERNTNAYEQTCGDD
jgi:DNA-binding MarR family transcriptional regulator